MPDHEHVYGPVELSRFTGNPHRKCTVPGCKFITLDLTDEDDDYDDAAETVETASR